MLTRVRDWLGKVPVDDPVDRLNAVFMQLILLYQGIVGPINMGYRFFLGHLQGYHRPQSLTYVRVVDLGTDLAIIVACWVCLAIIRRGHFRPAAIGFVGVVIACMLLAYSVMGFNAMPTEEMSIKLIALSGMMLGRRALWTCYGAYCVAITLAMTTDIWRSGMLHPGSQLLLGYNKLPSQLAVYLPIVIILDRGIAVLRRALDESDERGRRLQREMAERELAQGQLVHAQKMEAVGRLSSGIAHDFNNILGVILGFASERHVRPAQDLTPAERVDHLGDAMEGVETAARRGVVISEKLLNFSRRDMATPTAFDAGASLHELQPLLRQMLAPDVRLAIDTGAMPLFVHFDRHQFDLAVLNIASNARDAMPDGGEFRVRATCAANDGAVIEFSDDGTGMREEVRRHIFEPFFTTKAAGQGTGLGLAVIHDIVSRAGGYITVESTPGLGTTFKLCLPRPGRDDLAVEDTTIVSFNPA
jgi:signal transduction histidine kinase